MRGHTTKRIPLKSTSSSTKSLFGMATYIRYDYQVGDVIFIDEPEMNLDPMHQIEMADFLVELTAAGVHVVISTHSDYLLRATMNALLKRRVSQLVEVSIEGYYFTKNQVSPLGKIGEVDTIDIFDNVNVALEDEYFRLLDRLRIDSDDDIWVASYRHLKTCYFDVAINSAHLILQEDKGTPYQIKITISQDNSNFLIIKNLENSKNNDAGEKWLDHLLFCTRNKLADCTHKKVAIRYDREIPLARKGHRASRNR